MKTFLNGILLIVTIVAVTTAVKFTSVKFDEHYAPPKEKRIYPRLKKIEPIHLDIPSFGENPPVVRMYDKEGNFKCSGVVISSNYVLTAAHCVLTETGLLISDTLVIKSADKMVSVDSKAVSANPRVDVALVNGDFKDFKIVQVITSPNIIFNLKNTFINCGYPLGGDLLCVTFNQLSIAKFMYIAPIPLFPGDSGGPLFIVSLNSVIAVNSYVIGQLAYMGPTINLFESLGVEVIQ